MSKNKFKSKSKDTKALNKVDVKRLLADRDSDQPLAALNLLSCIMLEKPAMEQLCEDYCNGRVSFNCVCMCAKYNL